MMSVNLAIDKHRTRKDSIDKVSRIFCNGSHAVVACLTTSYQRIIAGPEYKVLPSHLSALSAELHIALVFA